jgi:L-fuconolactonase
MSEGRLTTVDAHQHFWDPQQVEYAWLSADTPDIYRHFGFDDLAPFLTRHSIDGTVLVQSADNDEDTEAMFAIAAERPAIAGIVGYVPLEYPDRAASRLATLQQRDKFVGIRNLIHDQPDPDWLLRPDVADGLRVLEDRGVPFDLVAVLPRHLEHVDYLSERFPALRIVIDHLAKPPVKTAEIEPWTTLIRRAAANPRVHAKVSGLYPAVGDWSAHGPDDLRPWIDRALEAFGPERLMIGSDWPIAVLAGGYDHVWQNLVQVITGYGPDVSRSVLGRTAVAFYGLE